MTESQIATIASGTSSVRDLEIREALKQHWAASNSGDFTLEHDIYHDELCRIIRSRASGFSAETTFRPPVVFNPIKSILLFTVSSDLETCGIQNAILADPFEPGAWREKWLVSMEASA
jgi:hypothetical protein